MNEKGTTVPATRRDANLVEIEKALNEACGIIEVGDQRLLAGDGPAGNLPPDISLTEWRRMYLKLDRARAKMLAVRHGETVSQPTLRAPEVTDAVKAGMVNRMNAMFSALTDIVEAFENDPFNGANTRYVVGDLIGYPASSADSVRLGSSHLVSAGMLRRAKHALSEAAYEGTTQTTGRRSEGDA